MTSLVNNLGGSAGFGEFSLARTDDGSTPFVDLRAIFGTQGINFFGQQYTGLYLNNNGSVTFNAAASSFTPTAITGSTSNPIIAAYWADIDTRGGAATPTAGGTSTGSNLLWYDLDSVTHTFTATWDDVGYFNTRTNKLNAFQLSITQINEQGDFDIVFRYENVDWTTGDFSGGSNGLGGTPARAGYSSGNGVDFFELPQSGDQAALLALEGASNVATPGTFVFHVRNGAATPAISVGDAALTEGNGPDPKYVVIPVFLAAPSSSTITVEYSTADGSAVAGQDYVGQSGVLTFAAGVTQQNIFVELTGDTVIEGNETFHVNLSNPVGAPIADGDGLVTIVDDDGLVISDVSALEGTAATPSSFTFTVSLLTAADHPVTVDFATTAGTASAGSDFAPTTGTLVFAAGETSKTVTVGVVADGASEADETFTVQLSNASGAGIADAVGQGTIINDDGLVIDDLTIVEGTNATPGTANVTIRLLSAVSGPVSVDWATAPGSATSPQDFTASRGTVTFEAGETSKTIRIPIVRDSTIEGTESFNVVLSNPSGTAIVDGNATVTLLDDDGFTVSDAVVTEGNSGATSLTFTVSLGSALASDATVHFATADGTATAGSDYTATSGVLTFVAGQTSQTVTVTVNGDLTPEADETLTLNLSNPSGTGIVHGSATGTIFNDDGLSIADTSLTEGNSGTTAVSVIVTLGAASASPITVDYATQDGTAVAGVDYVAATGQLTFAAGETSKTIQVQVNGDTQFEGDETFQVVLSNPVHTRLVDGTATVRIVNDDARPLPSFRIVDAALVEGTGPGSSVMRFQVALSEAIESESSVDFATSNGTAVAGHDYTATTGRLTIPAGSLFGFIDIPITRDAVLEADETFTVTLSNPSAGTTILDGSATGTILNDEVSLSIAATSADKAEGNSGSTPFTFTVRRAGDASQTASADWAVSGAAVNAADFAGGVVPSGTVTFGSGETSKVITIDVAGDTVIEGNEAFTVTLSNPSGAAIATASANGVIRNDDVARPSLSIAATSADHAEGNSGTTAFSFTVTRTGDTSGASSANWAVSGAAVDGADFAGGIVPSGTVSFAAGEITKIITVDVAGDTAVETDEAFTVTLSGATGATISTASAVGAIRNDDASLSIAATTADQAEGNSGATPYTFTVTRTGDASNAVSVSWAVSGAAVTGADFVGGVLPFGAVTFSAGETTKVITVDVAGDAIVESDEAFTVTLSNPGPGAIIGTASAHGVIRNDDASLSIASTSADRTEGNAGTTPFTFTVTRTGDTSGAASAAWAVSGAAVTGADFVGGVLPSGTVDFAAGESTKVITIDVAGDAVVEPDESFRVTLSNPSAGAVIGTASAQGVIRNDDVSVSIAATSADKAEGNSGTTPFTFTVTRAGDTSGVSTAQWTVTGAAVNAADFGGGVLPSGTVFFSAGETTKLITVDVAGDTVVEGNEGFTVSLFNPGFGTTIDTASAHGVIRNDDAVRPSLSIAATSANKAEGNAGPTPFTFTVTRTGDTSGASSAQWAVSGAAVDGADFSRGTLPSGTVRFAAGETSKVITINIAGDTLVEGYERFTVTLSDPVDAVVGTASASAVIRNDDASLSIAATSASKAEGNSGSTPFSFTVTRTGDTSTAVCAKWAVSGAAVDGADFVGGVLPSGVVGFAAGETSKVITVNVHGDRIVEGDEGFTVTLSDPDPGAVIGTASAHGVIRNDDASLSIAATSADKAEGQSGTTAFTFTVTRSGDTSGGASAAWTVGGAAVTGADFIGGVKPSGTVDFAAGETSKVITVNVAGDTVVEGNEGFTVTLSDPDPGAVIGTASAHGVIRNDDASLSIAARSADKAEGQSGTTAFTFTVSRTGDTSGAASAHWAVSGAAVNGADFIGGVKPSGTVDFAAGETSKVITVNVAGDTVVEGNEGFTVILSNPSVGAVIGTASAQGLIRNDDASLSIAATSADKAEGNSGVRAFAFTVTRTGDTSGAASVHWAVSGAAVDAADFVGGILPSGIVGFAAGETSQVIIVNVHGDRIVEGDEGFTVTLSDPDPGAVIGTASAHGVIRNDDASLSIAATSANKAEGNTGATAFTFTVTRTGDISGAASAHWVVSGTAVNAADFFSGVLPSGIVSFAAGETSRVITINVAGDTVVEGNEGFTVSLSNLSVGAVIGTASAHGVIRNDDASLSIAAASADKAEGQSGTTAFTFTVTRTGDTSGAASAHWAVSGAAVTGADFIGGVKPSGTVDFAAGETSRVITINVAGDTVVEGNEGFTVSLSNPSVGAVIGTASAQGLIRNDDASLSIAAPSADKAEGNSGARAFAFTVTRTGDTSTAVCAKWAVSGAAVDAADFVGGVLPSGVVGFAAGETSKVITVNVHGDRIVEGDEGFTVTLSDPDPGAVIGTASAHGVIRNDDASLSIAATSADKAEGNSGTRAFTFTVTRTGDTSGAASAHWAVSGAAVNAADFAGGVLPSGIVGFAAGETSRVITINVAGDTVVEGNEGFTVSLSNPSVGAVIGTASAHGVIRNDDASLSIAATSADKAEGQSGTTAFTFTVTRSGDTSGTASARWAVSGAAVNGADFIGGVKPSGTVDFAAGETSRVITINVAGDTVVEGNEGFTVILSNPTVGAVIGTASAQGVIRNDDASLSIAAPSADKAEGNSGARAFTFTVTRTGDTSGAASAHWAVSGAAVNGADFVGGILPSGIVGFAAGETSRVITINVAGDTVVEGNEGFTVSLSNPSVGAVIGTASAHGVIRNDDASLSIAATSADKAEGQSGTTAFTFTVTRSGDTSGTASAHWAASGAAVNAADFVGGILPSGIVGFAAGETSKVITVNVAGDTVVEGNEGFTVSLSNPSVGAVIGTASAHGVIRNDDASLAIAATSANKAEGSSGTTPFAFTVTRTGDIGGASSAHWVVSGAAVNAADFVGGVLPAGTVSFVAGETTKVITIDVAGDSIAEGNEGFTVTLSNPSAGAVIGTASANGVIRNDDASLAIAATSASKAEGNSGDTAFAFTVTRSGDTSGASSAHWAASGAAVNAADFAGGVLPSGVVSFAAGETSKVITVKVAGDTAVEANENFAVTLSGPSVGTTIGTGSAVGTIRNDDATLSIAAASADAAEGNAGTRPFTFTVTRSGDTSSALSVDWSVSGAAVNSSDFIPFDDLLPFADFYSTAASTFPDFLLFGGVLPSGTLDFAAGETSKVITVNVLGETLREADESFIVSLSNPGAGAVIGTSSAVGTIRNDDAATTSASNSLMGSATETLDNRLIAGRAGVDTFVFDQPLVAGDVTTIVDFAAGSEKLALAHSVFAAAGPTGPLKADAFFTGAAAHDASDRIIYNPADGHLLFDPDGNGAAAAHTFGAVSPGLPLTAANFKLT